MAMTYLVSLVCLLIVHELIITCMYAQNDRGQVAYVHNNGVKLILRSDFTGKFMSQEVFAFTVVQCRWNCRWQMVPIPANPACKTVNYLLGSPGLI